MHTEAVAHQSELSAFYEQIRSASCDFYRKRGSTLTGSAPLSWEELATVPFRERCFRDDGLITKVVTHRGKSALIARTVEELREEAYAPVTGERPLVCFERAGECVELSLWLYEKNILPLAGDRNPWAAVKAGILYRADAVFCDRATLEKYKDVQEIPRLAESVRQVAVLDKSPQAGIAEALFPRASVSYSFVLPEAGTVGTSCGTQENKKLLFHPAPQVYAEREDSLRITKMVLLPTPLLRYETNIPVRWVDSCGCGAGRAFFLA